MRKVVFHSWVLRVWVHIPYMRDLCVADGLFSTTRSNACVRECACRVCLLVGRPAGDRHRFLCARCIAPALWQLEVFCAVSLEAVGAYAFESCVGAWPRERPD